MIVCGQANGGPSLVSKIALKACPVRGLLWSRHRHLLSVITDH